MLQYFIHVDSIPNDIPKEIFNDLTLIINDKLFKTSCPYFNFNEKIHKPTELMKLRIFNANADTFQSMLKDINKSDECSLKRYVYKCIEVYREINSAYCSGGDDMKEENRNSCDIIRQFNNLYTFYIFNKEGILHNFPELSSNTPTNIIVGCPSEEIE
ncbi:hypothetical protein PCYB_007010 [Plasmodium cynomolgi strain B]|uniref:CYIR protein n=1 Tax=Plasmodium cynomolgi (strain B) TaxID=1120755 RepID=K6VKI5_PLACD|nr:hypothetical protein PCYB_007010 [Plasmodium cynomolgi strain B]GAB69952.1 hypothetical protein PCYB_007010 [Plasmodium cynomolgi strain B]